MRYDETLDYPAIIASLVLRNGAKRVCEVGGGANPSLSLQFLAENNIEYTLFDISQAELSKAPAGYLKVQGDITDPNLLQTGTYDMVVSTMLAEHVNDGQVFHRNVFNLLRPGGFAFHAFATLYGLSSVVNLLLRESVAGLLLLRMQPGRESEGHNAKFSPHYSWCRGPSNKQIECFRSCGFEVPEFTGVFGQDCYLTKFPLLWRLDRRMSAFLTRKPMPLLTSSAYVLLAKPETAG